MSTPKQEKIKEIKKPITKVNKLIQKPPAILTQLANKLDLKLKANSKGSTEE